MENMKKNIDDIYDDYLDEEYFYDKWKAESEEYFNNLDKYMEIFRDIEGYEGLYQVSNLGNVKSLKYGKWRLLKPAKSDNGYLQVKLYKNGKRKTYFVHRLVATVFLPNPDNLKEINHKDENSLNNRLENLEWCDRKYNNNYGTRNQKMVEARNKNCSYGAEKPVVQYTKNMIEVCRFKSAKQAERQTGIAQSNICNCCNGKLKSCGGFVWKYL